MFLKVESLLKWFLMLFLISSCTPSQQKNSLYYELTGGWKFRQDFKEEWLRQGLPNVKTVTLPQNFSKSQKIRQGYITLQQKIPKPLQDLLYQGYPITLNAGRNLDIAFFYFNDTLLGQKGNITPYRAGAMRFFMANIPDKGTRSQYQNTITIVLYSKGNFPLQTMDPVQLGSSNIIYSQHRNAEIISFILLTIYLVIGVYHLLLVARRRQDRYNLYFGIFCILVSGYWFVGYTTTQDLLFEKYAILHRKVEHVCMFVSSIFIYFFTVEYFHKKQTRFSKIYAGTWALASLILLFTPLSVMRMIRLLFYPFLFAAIIHQFSILLKAMRQKNWDAYYLISGFLLHSTGAIHDTLVSMGIYNYPYVGKYTLLLWNMGIAAVLANRFTYVMNTVEELNEELEQKVIARTQDLQKSLEKVNKLKEQQDGDYFLTSLLIKPLSGKFIRKQEEEKVQVDILVQQNKRFTFRNKQYEIGGDICIADRIQLQGKEYTVFLNADAMGKSIQGAGGVIVMGTVFRSLITRTKLNPQLAKQYPELWIKECFKELQNVFVSFGGSMLISTIYGLVEEDSGTAYYINSEHPYFVLFRDGLAKFLDTNIDVKKIGTEGIFGNLQVNTFQLQHGDSLLSGSDGRDDLVLGYDKDGMRVINEDESLFLQKVNEAEGDLQTIRSELEKVGSFMDDLSLLKLTYSHDRLSLQKEWKEKLTEVDTLIAEGKEKQIVDKLQQICAEYPGFPDAHLYLAKQYMSSRQYHKASQYYELYSQLNPADSESLLVNSILKKKLAKFSEAILFAERYRVRYPKNVRNLLHLIHLYYLQKNISKAQKLLEKALLLAPTHPKTLKLQARLASIQT